MNLPPVRRVPSGRGENRPALQCRRAGEAISCVPSGRREISTTRRASAISPRPSGTRPKNNIRALPQGLKAPAYYPFVPTGRRLATRWKFHAPGTLALPQFLLMKDCGMGRPDGTRRAGGTFMHRLGTAHRTESKETMVEGRGLKEVMAEHMGTAFLNGADKGLRQRVVGLPSHSGTNATTYEESTACEDRPPGWG